MKSHMKNRPLALVKYAYVAIICIASVALTKGQ